MTEYWQSQAKKFCDFCKCWITDNRPSIEFHENGKKHKDNVERRIKEVRKRGIQVRKDNDELKDSLKAIEAAALEAYKKDLGVDTIPVSETAPISYNQPVDAWKQRPAYSTTNTSPAVSELPKKGCNISYVDGQPVVRCIHHWSIGQSEQGYYYYYNTQSNATQWEVPSCLQTEESEESESQSSPSTNVEPDKDPPAVDNSTIKEEGVKKQDKQDKLDIPVKEESTSTQKPNPSTSNTVSGYSPYGAWTTVRTIEAPILLSRETQERIKNTIPEEQPEIEDPEVTAKNTEKKFKEKETPKISGPKTDGAVPFKKRKLNSERKRNIRQTKFDS